MNDNTALFFLFIIIVLVLVYRFSKPTGSYASDVPIGPGTYRIGEDLDPGKCDIVVVSGVGDICIKERGNDVWNNPFKLAADNPVFPARFRNMTLNPHDILEVNGCVKILLTPPSAIADGDGAELSLGIYHFGVDIPPAKYDLKATAGDGQVTFYAPDETEFSVYQDMSPDTAGKASTYQNLLCEQGARIEIDGSLKLKLAKSKKQRGRLHKMLDFINQDP